MSALDVAAAVGVWVIVHTGSVLGIRPGQSGAQRRSAVIIIGSAEGDIGTAHAGPCSVCASSPVLAPRDRTLFGCSDLGDIAPYHDRQIVLLRPDPALDWLGDSQT